MNEINNNPVKSEMKSIYMIFGVIFAVAILGVGISFITKKIKENDKKEDKNEEIVDKLEDKNEMEEAMVVVPDVSELTISEATKELKKKGFEVSSDYDEEYSEEIEKGLVAGTNPGYGEELDKGTEITLIISLGIEPIIIEDYTGKNHLEVKAELESKGLIVTIETKKVEGTYEEGSIVSQDAKAGEKLYEGDSIILYIPYVEPTYPSFVGEPFIEKDVKEFCTKYNIICTFEYNSSDIHEKNTIIEQSISSGEIIKENDMLKLIISSGKSEE